MCSEQVIIKCTGYEKNLSVADVIDNKHVHANGVVQRNLAYIAEALWDDVSASGYTNPFGSSYVEAVKFSTWTLLRDLQHHVMIRSRVCSFLERVDIA